MRALNFCNVRALKLQICPGAVVSSQSFFTRDGLVHTHEANGVVYFDARNFPGLTTRRVYGIISGNNGCGIYVPIGRQSTGAQTLDPVPICVGGGRDMCFTVAGLTLETDQQTIEREAREEIGTGLDILNMSPLAVPHVPANKASYYLLRLRTQLSTFQYSWDITDSDQVVAMRYWALPSTWESAHGPSHHHAPGAMAALIFDDLGCSLTHRPSWISEWHARAYDAAIGVMLSASVRLPGTESSGFYDLSRMYGNRQYTYRTTYAPYPTALQAEHEPTCNRHCAAQFDMDVAL